MPSIKMSHSLLMGYCGSLIMQEEALQALQSIMFFVMFQFQCKIVKTQPGWKSMFLRLLMLYKSFCTTLYHLSLPFLGELYLGRVSFQLRWWWHFSRHHVFRAWNFPTYIFVMPVCKESFGTYKNCVLGGVRANDVVSSLAEKMMFLKKAA